MKSVFTLLLLLFAQYVFSQITFPVNEVTIAGNMNDILKKITPANDLNVKENINSPTILVENMTLAGI